MYVDILRADILCPDFGNLSGFGKKKFQKILSIFEKKEKHRTQDLLVPVTTHTSVCVDD